MKHLNTYKNTFLYIVTVLIWGTTWYAIEFQLGEVAIEVSLIYRFGLAAVLILGLSKLKGLSLKFSLSQHLYIALLGSLNFCLNYFVLYEAQNYLSSAMTSIVFSMLLLANIVNARIFFGKKIVGKTYLGASLGILGIVALFWPEVSQYQTSTESLLGIGLVLAGVLFASFGNMISVRNSNHDYPVFQTSGFGMLYGTLFLVLIALYKGTTFSISMQPNYLISLAYLSIFGTVIAFYSYFYLLKQSKAADFINTVGVSIVDRGKIIISTNFHIFLNKSDIWKEMQSNRIGNLLSAARLKAGLSQTQLAEKLGIRQNMVSDYERGKDRNPGMHREWPRRNG